MISIGTLIDSEHQELEALVEERSKETKRLQLERFSKLPASLRQYVVDTILWHKACDDIGYISAPKSPREIELEGKNIIGLNSFVNTSNSSARLTVSPRIPNGITEEELIQAHNNACMEEVIKDRQ